MASLRCEISRVLHQEAQRPVPQPAHTQGRIPLVTYTCLWSEHSLVKASVTLLRCPQQQTGNQTLTQELHMIMDGHNFMAQCPTHLSCTGVALALEYDAMASLLQTQVQAADAAEDAADTHGQCPNGGRSVYSLQNKTLLRICACSERPYR